MLSFFPLMGMAVFLGRCHGHENSQSLLIPRPNSGAEYVPRDLQSFSIEFAFFPDYAGNKSHPNHFSKNLLENFKDLTGVYPLVRVGGTSQWVLMLFSYISGTWSDNYHTEIIRTTSRNRKKISSLYTSIPTMINRSKSIMDQHSLNLTIHLDPSSFCMV
jgi:hypothetical protein